MQCAGWRSHGANLAFVVNPFGRSNSTRIRMFSIDAGFRAARRNDAAGFEQVRNLGTKSDYPMLPGRLPEADLSKPFPLRPFREPGSRVSFSDSSIPSQLELPA
jgi:hypothetical protein